MIDIHPRKARVSGFRGGGGGGWRGEDRGASKTPMMSRFPGSAVQIGEVKEGGPADLTNYPKWWLPRL